MLARNRITGAAAEVLNPLLLGKRRPPAGYDDEAGTTEKSVSTHAFDAGASVGGESLHELQEGGMEGGHATAEGGKAAKRKKSKLGASGAAAREVSIHLATTP